MNSNLAAGKKLASLREPSVKRVASAAAITRGWNTAAVSSSGEGARRPARHPRLPPPNPMKQEEVVFLICL